MVEGFDMIVVGSGGTVKTIEDRGAVRMVGAQSQFVNDGFVTCESSGLELQN
jgi:hypothetical protein